MRGNAVYRATIKPETVKKRVGKKTKRKKPRESPEKGKKKKNGGGCVLLKKGVQDGLKNAGLKKKKGAYRGKKGYGTIQKRTEAGNSSTGEGKARGGWTSSKVKAIECLPGERLRLQK